MTRRWCAGPPGGEIRCSARSLRATSGSPSTPCCDSAKRVGGVRGRGYGRGQDDRLVDYRDLDPCAGAATHGVTIGEREFWGRGYSSDALRLLAGHLFGAYGLSRLELDTWSGNERAVRTSSRLGFREEGRRRPAVLVRGKRYNSMLFGMLREEWAAE
jgi:RimJ/RimL family protein N-acetyltransferase